MVESYVKISERHGFYSVNIMPENGESLVVDFGRRKYSIQYNGRAERYFTPQGLTPKMMKGIVTELMYKYLRKQRRDHLIEMLGDSLKETRFTRRIN